MDGFEALHHEKTSKGLLFLPNHPAEIDPLILMLILWPRFQPHPIVIEHFYYQKMLRFLMDLVGSLPLPNLEIANAWKIRQVNKLKNEVLSRLQKGEHFLIYPSGKLKTTSDEKVGGASFVYDLIQADPEIPVVLIRTVGLWGSLFSRALSGERPDFFKMVRQGVKIALKNGLFFVPKREVKITFEKLLVPKEVLASRQEFNQFLEKWYNQYPEAQEPLKLVSYAFWKEELSEVKPLNVERKTEKAHEVTPEQRSQILEQISKISRFPIQQIHDSTHLSNDLGLDSLDTAQLAIFLEERFDLKGIEAGQLQIVEDLFLALAGKKMIEAETPEKKKQKEWPAEVWRAAPEPPYGETLQEAFLYRTKKMARNIAAADNLTGVITYSRYKKLVLVLALKIAELPGEHVGILLPASVATYGVILAVTFAGKIPVMLNWTSGERALEHAVKTCHIKVVLSSLRFLGRVENADLSSIDELLIPLEELRRKISFKQKFYGILRSYFPNRWLKESLRHIKPDDTFGIIFTSGTETLPKGVPLSHRNLLSNMTGMLQSIQLSHDEIAYSVLPPFHSFGFNVTGLLTLLCGIKTFFSADPTNAHQMADDIAHWKPTMVCLAPSFLRNLLRIARREQLASVRLFVTGAEKLPDALITKIKEMAPSAKIIEGYGISECSPVVTMDRLEEGHKGVGKPLPNVEIRIINPETKEILQGKSEGEVCIHGPGVFKGYLGTAKDPFIQLEGKRWYRSGDRGFLDSDGTLFITGRLKRFAKIGGEMVSLGGLEEELIRLAQAKNWVPADQTPHLALVAREEGVEKTELILFSTAALDREKINEALREAGESHLIKVAEVKQIPEIPLTGTGKTHYRLLEENLTK